MEVFIQVVVGARRKANMLAVLQVYTKRHLHMQHYREMSIEAVLKEIDKGQLRLYYRPLRRCVFVQASYSWQWRCPQRIHWSKLSVKTINE